MSNAAKVTVVIPNYNGLKFMEPCFKALEMQICRDFEILVVDNGSGDGSVEWLRSQVFSLRQIPDFPELSMWGSGRQKHLM